MTNEDKRFWAELQKRMADEPTKTFSVVFVGDGSGGVVKTVREYDNLGDAAQATIERVNAW